MTMSDEPPARSGAPESKPPADRAREEGARPARPGAERETVPYIDDPWTKVFVGLVIVVFVAIFLNAFLLGRGGLLTTTPSPSPAPSVTATPVPSPTATPIATATPSATPSATGSVAPSATP